MGLVQIDRVDAEPPKARVQRPGQVGAGQPLVVGPVAHREAALRRDDDLVPDPRPSRQPTADDLLRHAPRVHVGGVDEVAAPLDEPVELSVRHLLGALVAERHRADALRRHDRAGG